MWCLWVGFVINDCLVFSGFETLSMRCFVLILLIVAKRGTSTRCRKARSSRTVIVVECSGDDMKS